MKAVIDKYAKEYGFDPRLFYCIPPQESAWDRRAHGPGKKEEEDWGLFQVTSETIRDLATKPKKKLAVAKTQWCYAAENTQLAMHLLYWRCGPGWPWPENQLSGAIKAWATSAKVMQCYEDALAGAGEEFADDCYNSHRKKSGRPGNGGGAW